MIYIFVYQNGSQQTSSSDSFVNRATWKCSDKYSFFVFRSIFGPDITFDVKVSRYIFQFLGHFFSDTNHISGIYLGLDNNFLNRQMIGKRHATGMIFLAFLALVCDLLGGLLLNLFLLFGLRLERQG